MNPVHDDTDFAETAILEDRQRQEPDPEATAVLGEDYRRAIESGAHRDTPPDPTD